jgi:hypothetical protein
MSKNNRGLVIVGMAVLIIVSCVCLPSGSVATSTLEFVKGASPTEGLGLLLVATSTPNFRIGQTYWVNGVEPEGSLSQGMPNESTILYNKPSDNVGDSTVTWLFFIPAGEPVRVDGVEGRFCYVVGEDPEAIAKVPFNGESFFEGWMTCKYLLSFQPTPFPTPNLTPQSP